MSLPIILILTLIIFVFLFVVNAPAEYHVTDIVIEDEDEDEDEDEREYIYPSNDTKPKRKTRTRTRRKSSIVVDPSFPSTKAKAMYYMERGYRLERRERYLDEEWIMWPCFDRDGTPYFISKQTGRVLARDPNLVDMSHLYDDTPGHDWSHRNYVVEVLYVE